MKKFKRLLKMASVNIFKQDIVLIFNKCYNKNNKIYLI